MVRQQTEDVNLHITWAVWEGYVNIWMDKWGIFFLLGSSAIHFKYYLKVSIVSTSALRRMLYT